MKNTLSLAVIIIILSGCSTMYDASQSDQDYFSKNYYSKFEVADHVCYVSKRGTTHCFKHNTAKQ